MASSVLKRNSDRDHRMSLAGLCTALVAVGWIIALLSECVSSPVLVGTMGMVLIVGGIAGAVLGPRFPAVGRWISVLALVAVAHMGYAWLGSPALLVLATVPVGVTSDLLGAPSAVGVSRWP